MAITPEQENALAADLHAIMCGGPRERYDQAFPATQARYRQMVRHVLDRVPSAESTESVKADRHTIANAYHAQSLTLDVVRKERDDQQARGDELQRHLEKAGWRVKELEKERDEQKARADRFQDIVDSDISFARMIELEARIAALEKAARVVCENTMLSTRLSPGWGEVPFQHIEWLRAALDATQPKDSGSGGVLLPTDEEPRNRVAPAVENTGQPISRAEFDQLRADVTTLALIQRPDYDPHSGVYADLTDIIQRGEKARET